MPNFRSRVPCVVLTLFLIAAPCMFVLGVDLEDDTIEKTSTVAGLPGIQIHTSIRPGSYWAPLGAAYNLRGAFNKAFRAVRPTKRQAALRPLQSRINLRGPEMIFELFPEREDAQGFETNTFSQAFKVIDEVHRRVRDVPAGTMLSSVGFGISRAARRDHTPSSSSDDNDEADDNLDSHMIASGKAVGQPWIRYGPIIWHRGQGTYSGHAVHDLVLGLIHIERARLRDWPIRRYLLFLNLCSLDSYFFGHNGART